MHEKQYKKQLAKGLAALGCQLTSDVQAQMLAYLDLLKKWNQVYNLTAITALESMITLHVLDSLTVLPYLQGRFVLDVGTGAGLPGIVLALADPKREYFLLDSASKKTVFLKHVVNNLAIPNITVIHHRVADYHPQQLFDVILTRAFSSLRQMTESSLHLLKKDGIWLAMKGIYPTEEIAALPSDVKLIDVITCEIPGESVKRHLVKLQYHFC